MTELFISANFCYDSQLTLISALQLFGIHMPMRISNNEQYYFYLQPQMLQHPAFKLAMTLPGSRPDILRKANISGPSPVGGSSGGTTDKFVRTLDEFEYQAAHYNLACTHACLGDIGESVNNLRKAFENGFDNYATVRADPDLAGVRESKEFERLMDEFDPRRGFNPFGVFGS